MTEINIVTPTALEAFETFPFQYCSGHGNKLVSFEDYSCFVNNLEIGFHVVSQLPIFVASDVKCVNYGISLVNLSSERVLVHARMDNDLIYQLDVEQMQTLMSFLLRVAAKRNEDIDTGKAIQYLIDTLDLADDTSLMVEPERHLKMTENDHTRPTVVQYTFSSMIFTTYSAETDSSPQLKTPPIVVVTSSKDINTIQKLFSDTGDYSLYKLV